MNYQSWLGIFLRTLFVILVIIATYYVIGFALPLIYPFLFGWLIAMCIEPMVRWLEKRGSVPRWLSVTLILSLLLGLIFTLVIFLIAEIVVELTLLANLLPEYFETARLFFVDIFTKENTDLQRIIDTLQIYLQQNPQHQQQIADSISNNLGIIANKSTSIITGFLTGIGAFIGNLPFYITVLVFIVLAAFFIALDWPRLKVQLAKLIPNRVKTTSGVILVDLKKALFGFVRAQLILMSMTAVLMFIGLLIIGVPYAFTIALIMGLVDLLPYIGVGAIVIPWAIYAFFTGNIQIGVGLLIIYGIMIVIRQIIEPRLLASTVGLDPLLTLIAIFIGLQLFGILGIVIGPLSVVILLALHRANVFRDLWRFIRADAKG